jgi:hypothetical protein
MIPSLFCRDYQYDGPRPDLIYSRNNNLDPLDIQHRIRRRVSKAPAISPVKNECILLEKDVKGFIVEPQLRSKSFDQIWRLAIPL